ncbi:pyridoxamine 5'-phosphate oxidase family protein [Actinoplanes derwentensis]|uniref:Pyridoxamine 5'-phosphate oxidase N-terminal domain-containing protein n=1 Tax=Actinoplanes derwentensis TaxID=113562 RepID=A0A1H1XMN8_9ACTN|nr:pyridoxamine 5'-phosphate oxidase family protein [Actinoplanes derwentensis]GID87720.1 pyridoxamine 5'-phosphate oxidase [Actinoplanes derwentensis]SDT10433.1 hypothetical protein SAMN04489716_2517 [Actinoplanes derwentensis]
MPYRYLNALETPSVEAAQREYGSHTAMRRLIAGYDTGTEIGDDEAAFIAERDTFYLGTVGESGWPYVQHRGGPPGFLRVLSPTLLGWADYRGNRQYVSVGNLGSSAKVSLLLMDYPLQRRLKILGEARVVDARRPDAADLVALVSTPDYRAYIERVITVEVHAFDWNCPQHITPRWTQDELAPALEKLQNELADLRETNQRLRRELGAPPA